MSTDVGAFYRSSLEVYDDTGALATPATKTCIATKPDQVTANLTVIVDSQGKLHADHQGMIEGLYRFDWATTSPITSKTDYENFIVWRSAIGLGEARNYLQVTDKTRDDILRGIMAAATEQAESVVGTCVIRTITNQHIPGNDRAAIRLPSGPLPNSTLPVTVTSEWPGGPTWINDQTHTQLLVYPNSGVVEPLNMMGFYYGPWKATYTAGRAIISARIQLALKEIIYDLWSNQRGILDDSLSPDDEEMAAREAQVPPDYEMPAHARAMLEAEAMPGFA